MFGMFCSTKKCCRVVSIQKNKETGQLSPYSYFKSQIIKSLDLTMKYCPDCNLPMFVKKINYHDKEEIEKWKQK